MKSGWQFLFPVIRNNEEVNVRFKDLTREELPYVLQQAVDEDMTYGLWNLLVNIWEDLQDENS